MVSYVLAGLWRSKLQGGAILQGLDTYSREPEKSFDFIRL
jgi:hypothetical protein